MLRHVGYANQSDNPPVSVTLDYTFNDGQGTLLGGARSATQSLTVNISEVNDAPSATNDALSAVAEDSGQRTILGSALTGNDSTGPANESGQTLTVTAVSNVVGGSAIVSGGNVLFTPTADFNGAASFDYTVTDNGTTNGASTPQTATATASFTVTEVNDAPSATNDALSAVAEDSGQRTILGASLTGNDSTWPCERERPDADSDGGQQCGRRLRACQRRQRAVHADGGLQRGSVVRLHGHGQRHHQRRVGSPDGDRPRPRSR